MPTPSAPRVPLSPPAPHAVFVLWQPIEAYSINEATVNRRCVKTQNKMGDTGQKLFFSQFSQRNWYV